LKRIIRYIAALFLTLPLIIVLSEFSPIFDFEEPEPFSGPDIYNPYTTLDTAIGWKRTCLHTHSKVDNILNECPLYPDEVYDAYMKLGYDIVTFANHNVLTRHPVDSLQVDLYEHGINLFKLHKMVFAPKRMILHDVLIPFLPSQKQFEYDYLSRNADFIVMNHPDRTDGMDRETMRKLTGYRILECDCGCWQDCWRWDEALSAGHYCTAIADDDNHDPRDSWGIALCSSWQNAKDGTYPEIKRTLLSGCGYSMWTPDFGSNNWDVKYRENKDLPSVRWTGLCGTDTVKVEFDRPAQYIVALGQDRALLDSVCNTSVLTYRFKPEDSYVRITAHFDRGVIIYLNPFARYDSQETETPYVESPHPVNWPLTILYNLAILLLASGFVFVISRLLFPHPKGKA